MSSIQRAGRALLDRLDARAVPDSLSRCWLALPPQAAAEWVWRVRRDRVDIVPWLDRTRPLRGASVVEVGAGRGASTFALCEQGAQVTAYDLDQPGLDEAAAHLGAAGLAADLRCENATALADLALATLDWVMFWASLEHMVHTERIAAIRGAWAALRPGGRIVVHGVTVETEALLVDAYRAHGGQLARLGVETAEPIGRFLGWTPLRAVTQWSCSR